MLKEGFKWEATHIGRRGFLGRSLVAAFGLFAAASMGDVSLASACTGTCTAPNGGGRCDSTLCRGSQCSNNGYIYCGKTTLYCETGTGCWSNGQGTCCDCNCSGPGIYFYCYCFGLP